MNDTGAAAENRILDDYISELVHDRATLERYLKLYPDAADALHDLHFALQTRGLSAVAAKDADEEAWIDDAMARMRNRLRAAPADPFQSMTPEQLLSLRQKLGIRAGTLKGFCDRHVDVATVPRHFLQAFATDLGQTLTEFLAFLVQPPKMAASQSFKADGRPSAPAAKISFAQLLEQANEPDEVRSRLLGERD